MNTYQPKDSRVSPRFSGIHTFMGLPHVTDPHQLDVALTGIPFDGGTSYRSGTRFGPSEIRVQSKIIGRYNPVLQVNPFEKFRVADYGDLDTNPLSIEDSYQKIENGIRTILNAEARPFAVGGDHSISFPILRALAQKHGPMGMIHLDAHCDTYDRFWGEKYSHASPFRRAIEENLLDPQKVIQVGLRGQLFSEEDYAFNREHGVTMIPIETVFKQGISYVGQKIQEFNNEGIFYLSFDIDVVDPAFAPGTGYPQIGGLTSFQAVQLVRTLQGIKFAGCDLVEVAPPFDSASITSLLASNLIFEMLCIL